MREPSCIGAALVAAMLAAVRASDAGATELERLVMPGQVASAHAKIETHCERCHEPFSRKFQSRLCLDCHKEIAADIAERAGHHGRIGDPGSIVCTQCHGEHEGRSADIVRLDVETFDHTATDFALAGAHVRVACRACHSTNKHYRDTPSRCVDCHRGEDPHRGMLGEQCEKCHASSAWRESSFDHAKTAFALSGAHATVACDQCHPNARYADTPTTCEACHRLDDVHGGHNGTRCDECHTTSQWKRLVFDHDRATRFPLQGRHRTIACNACHLGPLHQEKLASDCYACHRPDDAHKGRRGRDCASCHEPAGWKQAKFDHARDAGFPLRGAHAPAPCESCHAGNLHEEKLPTTCVGCHHADDVHGGAEGDGCQTCHNERGWDRDVFFDHDLSRFPLIGLHRLVPCEECHVTPAYARTDARCIACHPADDHHDGRLGADCASCHNPNDWSAWTFDHDRQTDFALDGGHAGLVCESCHGAKHVERVEASSACFACHASDDVHRGGFGRLCGGCHTTEAFDKLRMVR
jgi:hypothetical protein